MGAEIWMVVLLAERMDVEVVVVMRMIWDEQFFLSSFSSDSWQCIGFPFEFSMLLDGYFLSSLGMYLSVL